MVTLGKNADKIFESAKYAEEVIDGVNPKNLIKNAAEAIPDKGYKRFRDLKKYLGSAGNGNEWHHIVEQSQIGKRANFSAKQVNNVNNIISIPDYIHDEISAAYSRLYKDGKTLRDWLATKSFEEQMEFGLEMLQTFGTVTIENGRWVFTPFN